MMKSNPAPARPSPVIQAELTELKDKKNELMAQVKPIAKLGMQAAQNHDRGQANKGIIREVEAIEVKIYEAEIELTKALGAEAEKEAQKIYTQQGETFTRLLAFKENVLSLMVELQEGNDRLYRLGTNRPLTERFSVQHAFATLSHFFENGEESLKHL